MLKSGFASSTHPIETSGISVSGAEAILPGAGELVHFARLIAGICAGDPAWSRKRLFAFLEGNAACDDESH
jgi:hypothetical protein